MDEQGRAGLEVVSDLDGATDGAIIMLLLTSDHRGGSASPCLLSNLGRESSELASGRRTLRRVHSHD